MTAGEYQTIDFALDGSVAVITLSRPAALNALTVEMVDEISDALGRIEAHGGARAVLITGAGKAFCAGADMAAGTGANRGGELDAGKVLEIALNPLIHRLDQLNIPIVAAVNGAAVGAGASIALAADIVLAARSSFFLLAFSKVGLVPDSGITWILPRLIGSARAQAMMLLADKVSAAEAVEWGLIHEVIDDEALPAAARALAGKLAAGPTRAYGLIRHALRQSWSMSLPEVLALERENQRIAGVTGDFGEGVAAFRAKRAPQFKGR